MAERVRSLRVYLERALGAIAAEAPFHFRSMQRCLGERRVSLRVGDEPPLRVCLAGEAPWVGQEPDADIRVELAAAALDAFLLGELTLEQGLAEERISVRGKLDDVLSALETLELWLHGALRSPSAAALHHEYLQSPMPSESAQRGMP